MAPASEPPTNRTHPLTGVVQGAIFAALGFFGLVGSGLSNGGFGDLPLLLAIPAALVGSLLVGCAAGYWIWWSTTYVIDTTEVRIDKGVLWRSSRRIAFERIQAVDVAEPLLARLFGLAELRIDAAGGKGSRTALKFLPLATCQALRQILLERVHGVDAEPDEFVGDDAVIVVVPPQRLLLAVILTLDFLGTVLATVVVVVAAVVTAGFLDAYSIAVLGAVLPLGSALVTMVGRRVLADWDFRLTRTSTGLRIERGLLSRVSQTIGFDRIQGVALKEPYLWRRLGWVRLEVDVAGQASSAGKSENGTDTTPTLAPIVDRAMARSILAEVVPGAVPDGQAPIAVPGRAWPFAPVGWRYRWVGADAVAFIDRSGWLHRTTDVVPHARTQSVAIRQGPLQRRLGVATLEVHTPDGPVDAKGRHLDASDARTVAFAQLERARRARV